MNVLSTQMERARAVLACCLDPRLCRLIGPAIGWMGIISSIMVMKVFTQKSTEQSVLLKVDIYDNLIVVVSGNVSESFLLSVFFSKFEWFNQSIHFSIQLSGKLWLARRIEEGNSMNLSWNFQFKKQQTNFFA